MMQRNMVNIFVLVFLISATIRCSSESISNEGGESSSSVSVAGSGDFDNTFQIKNMFDLRRELQLDPSTVCTIGGGHFTCRPNAIDFAGYNTTIEYQFQCLLEQYVEFDWQRARGCRCSAYVNNNGTRKVCPCAICPRNNKLTAAINCTNHPDDPYITPPESSLNCTSIDCAMKCNGTYDMSGDGYVPPSATDGAVATDDPDALDAANTGSEEGTSAAALPSTTLVTSFAAAIAIMIGVSF